MSLWNKIKEKAKDTYKRVDEKLGGYLPGGVKPGSSSGGSSSSGSSSSSSPSSSSSSGTSSSSSSSSGSSSSGKSSGGGGGSSLLSSIGGTISKGYQAVDSKLGGYLPGGQTPQQIKQEAQAKTLVSQQTQNKTSSSNPLMDLINNRSSSSSSFNQSSVNQSQSFGEKVESIKQSTPLGSPSVEVKQPWYKKAGGVLGDAVTSALSPLGAGYTSHFGTQTTKTGQEVKDSYKTNLKKSASDTIIFGIPGVIGFNTKGKFNVIGKGDVGLPGDSPVSRMQRESYSTFRDWRKEKDQTLAKQQAQQDLLKSTGYNLENEQKKLMGDLTGQDLFDIASGKKTFEGVQEEKKSSFGYQSKEFEKEVGVYSTEVDKINTQIESYTKKVDEFNQKYSGKDLTKRDYEIALKESKSLESEQKVLLGLTDSLNLQREGLLKRQKSLETQYYDYENKVLGSVEKLRKAGVETTFNAETGELEFNSKALSTKVQPAGWQWQDSLKATNGKGIAGTNISWKNVALGGASLVPVATEFVAVGLLTGGTGTLARVGAGISKLPKLLKVGTYVGLGAVATYGVAQKVSVGSKYAKQNELPGWFGGTLGGATAITEIGAFAVGGYYGSKMYFNRVGDKILAGKYTKSVAETRQGVIQYQDGTAKGGIAKQLGIYETKIKGTEWKIKTGAELVGQYGTNKQGGVSGVKLISQFEGKAPKGMPKSFVTKGQTLETDSWIKLRAFTKSSKAKNWYSQDFIIQRTLLDKKLVNVKGKPGFEGYESLERLLMLNKIKSVGKPVKVGKYVPNKITEVWKQDELFRFAQWKGKGKVVQPWEWGEAKPDSISATKQFVLYKEIKPKPLGDVVVKGNVAGKVYSSTQSLQKFDSIAQTRGASVELLKQALKNKVLVIKETQFNMIADKRGSLILERPKISTSPGQIQKVMTKVKPSPALQTDVALKNALRVNLEKVVPGLMQQQLKQSLKGLLLVGASGVGTAQILSASQQIKLLEKQSLATKQQSMQIQQLAQLQPQQVQTATRQAVVPIQAVAQTPALETLTPPTFATPPIVTGFPIIPGLPAPDLYGWGWKEPKETLRGKSGSAYLPDFTSKALGLKPKVLSKAQLKKLLKTEFSGFEIRRGVIPS